MLVILKSILMEVRVWNEYWRVACQTLQDTPPSKKDDAREQSKDGTVCELTESD